MTERPILFSAPMVQAILDGRKTQTRRLVNPKLMPSELSSKCPFGKVGDRLWVREAFKVVMAAPGYDNGIQEGGDHDFGEGVASVLYSADKAVKTFCELDDKEDEQAERMLGRGMPSIHMPRWASRIDLQITDIRVELLQNMTADDARSEGAPVRADNDDAWALGWFKLLWLSIYGGVLRDSNPMVWVVEFKRVGT